MNLRPYQISSKLLIREAFSRFVQSVILLKPTGAGKTVTFSSIAYDAVAAGTPTMILCNRKELIGQAKKKLNALGLFPTIIDPNYTPTISNLYLASIDTLRNRVFPNIGLLIVDECDIRAFDEIVLHYRANNTFIIGVTATAGRKGKKFIDADKIQTNNPIHVQLLTAYRGRLCDVYQEIIAPITITELIDQNYLVPAITIPPVIDLDEVATTTNRDGEKEYSEKSMFSAYNKKSLYAGTVDNYLKFSKGKKAICFNVNVEHSKITNDEFISRGIKAAHIDGKTPDKMREQILRDFEFGDIMVLNNYGIVIAGYDAPIVECIILNHKTLSLRKYLQCCGRGSRPFPGKYQFKIIDQGGNYYQFGFWQQEREWSLDEKFISDKIDAGPIRQCENENCGALIPLSARQCPYCTIQQEKAAEEERKLLQAEFEELEYNASLSKVLSSTILASMPVGDLEQYRIQKEYQIGWIVRHLLNRGRPALEEYANLKKYSISWVDKQLSLVGENKQKAKDQLWEFVKINSHLTPEQVSEHTKKMLKATHNNTEIEILLPKILDAKMQLI